MPSNTTTTAHLMMTGHILDSLTLSKVFDKILDLGGDYLLNDLQIGLGKKDFSYLNLTVETETPEQLDRILAELKPYGVAPVENASATLQAATADGVVDEHAYTSHALPTAVHVEGQWIPVEAHEKDELVLVVNLDCQTAVFKKPTDVKAKELVVVGLAGLRW